MRHSWFKSFSCFCLITFVYMSLIQYVIQYKRAARRICCFYPRETLRDIMSACTGWLVGTCDGYSPLYLERFNKSFIEELQEPPRENNQSFELWHHPSNRLTSLRSRLFGSHLPKPGVDTETGRYPSHRSNSPTGSPETHPGGGPQRGDDDAEPQWNHPECESLTRSVETSGCLSVELMGLSLLLQMTALSVGYIQTYRDSVDSLGESVDMSIKVCVCAGIFICLNRSCIPFSTSLCIQSSHDQSIDWKQWVANRLDHQLTVPVQVQAVW